jgi:N,N'-diacetyllegionaminate synthase
MRIGNFDTEQQVIVIAEVGNNHEGSYTLAEELIGKAKESGADVVKFQTIVPTKLVSPTQEERIKQLSRFQFSYAQFESLAKTAEKEGIIFMSTPFDLDSAEFLNSIVPAFKIASGDNTFYPLLQKIASFAKPIILSTGLASIHDVEHTVNVIKAVWSNVAYDASQSLALLHCVVSYPAPPEEANLRAIQTLKSLSDVVGYSDHVIGIDSCVAAVALGARIVEKHFTIDKNYSAFRDHQLSADPHDLSQMVAKIRYVESMLGNGEKVARTSEESNRLAVRRSVVATRTIEAGSIISHDDITWVRPGGGIAPGDEYLIVGKIARHHIEQGVKILQEDVE